VIPNQKTSIWFMCEVNNCSYNWQKSNKSSFKSRSQKLFVALPSNTRQYYTTESFHYFRVLAKFIFSFGWYFKPFLILWALALSIHTFQYSLYGSIKPVICEMCSYVLITFILWSKRVHPWVILMKIPLLLSSSSHQLFSLSVIHYHKIILI
jgi:hypothetical protein